MNYLTSKKLQPHLVKGVSQVALAVKNLPANAGRHKR